MYIIWKIEPPPTSVRIQLRLFYSCSNISGISPSLNPKSEIPQISTTIEHLILKEIFRNYLQNLLIHRWQQHIYGWHFRKQDHHIHGTATRTQILQPLLTKHKNFLNPSLCNRLIHFRPLRTNWSDSILSMNSCAFFDRRTSFIFSMASTHACNTCLPLLQIVRFCQYTGANKYFTPPIYTQSPDLSILPLLRGVL